MQKRCEKFDVNTQKVLKEDFICELLLDSGVSRHPKDFFLFHVHRGLDLSAHVGNVDALDHDYEKVENLRFVRIFEKVFENYENGL